MPSNSYGISSTSISARTVSIFLHPIPRLFKTRNISLHNEHAYNDHFIGQRFDGTCRARWLPDKKTKQKESETKKVEEMSTRSGRDAAKPGGESTRNNQTLHGDSEMPRGGHPTQYPRNGLPSSTKPSSLRQRQAQTVLSQTRSSMNSKRIKARERKP